MNIPKRVEADDPESGDATESKEWERFYVKFYLNNLKNRTLLINADIDDDIVERHTLQLITMDRRSHDPITVYINSNGGDLYESFNFADVVASIKSPVNTVCLSHAFSGGFIIFMSGKERTVYKNSILMMHPIRSWYNGENVPAVLKEAEFLDKMTKRLAGFFASRTEKSERFWEQKVLKSAHDVYFFPEDAMKYGIATHIKENNEVRKENG